MKAIQIMKKLLTFALAAALLLSLAACGGAPLDSAAPAADGVLPADATPTESATAADGTSADDAANAATVSQPLKAEIDENTVVLGDIATLSGDFRCPGWSDSYVAAADLAVWGDIYSGAADLAVWSLTTGYAVMESDRNGAYQWNATAVKEHTVTENADGTATFHVEIAHDLTYSDGIPITVKDYLARLLAFSTQAGTDAGASGQTGRPFVGFDAFYAYTGDNAGTDVDGVTANQVFSGVRMLDAYTYELTVRADLADYFAYTYAALWPDVPALWLGEGVDILDDGEGCYLSDAFYAKSGSAFRVAKTIKSNRYDTTTFPFSGPYTVAAWDKDALQVTLRRNPAFKGNFEGQRPAIETLVYTGVADETDPTQGTTRLQQLQSGAVDVLPAQSGGDEIDAALALANGGPFATGSYQRAGCGKLEFACDFGPTMFAEVRQALAHLLDRDAFCQAFLDGYGVVPNGPYSPDCAMWRAVGETVALDDYAYDPAAAVKLLEDGGWVYNSKGQPYQEGAGGVDAVRYKKLTPVEAEALDGANKRYASVANTDGVIYRTVEVDGAYYLPLAINWLGTEQSFVTDLLSVTLEGNADLAAAGMVVRATTCDPIMLRANLFRDDAMEGYDGQPTYGLFNLVTTWPSSVYDCAYQWSTDPAYAAYSANRLCDAYDLAFPYDPDGEKLTYAQAMAASGGKLGLDYLSMAMVYNAKDEDEYNAWWRGYIERWNQLLPDIPLYANTYYYIYNTKLENFALTPFFGQHRAILYASLKTDASAA